MGFDRIRRVLRERAWLIVAVTLVFTGVALYFDSKTQTVYDVTATIAVEAGSAEASLLYNARYEPNDDPDAGIQTFESVVLPKALKGALKSLAASHPSLVLGGAPIALPGEAGTVRVGLRHPRPADAVVLANAIAKAAVREARDEERRAIGDLIRVERHRARRLGKSAETDLVAFFERRAIEERITTLRVLRDSAVGARMVAPAAPSGTPAFRRGERVPPMFVLGLCLALVAAFLLDVFARSPRDPRQLAAAAGLPLVAVIPRLRRRGAGADHAFQRLRAVVESGGDGAPLLIAVASARPEGGKSTVAVGLAEAGAATGRRTCVVEANVARPALAGRLGITGPGLADVLRGEAEHQAALHELSAGPDGPTVSVMPAGAVRPGDDEMLRSVDWGRVVGRLRQVYDLIVIEAAAFLDTADGLAPAAMADGVVLVARAGGTPADEIRDAQNVLAREGFEPLGLVVSDVPRRAAVGRGLREPRSARRRRRRWVAAAPSLRGGP